MTTENDGTEAVSTTPQENTVNANSEAKANSEELSPGELDQVAGGNPLVAGIVVGSLITSATVIVADNAGAVTQSINPMKAAKSAIK